MGPVQLFDLASQQAAWLSFRQSIVAGNIANADTPGYAAKDITPFAEIYDKSNLTPSRTNTAHLLPVAAAPGEPGTLTTGGWEVSHSGNSVRLEQELIKAGEVSGKLGLNTAIVKSFHRMMMMAVRSGP